MVNAWLAPQPTTTAPLGLIEPPAPALAVIVYGQVERGGDRVVAGHVRERVARDRALPSTPSTRTSAIVWHASAAIVNAWSAPQFTLTLPLGLIEPPAPAEAVIVYVLSANDAAIVWLPVTFVNV